MQWLCNQHKGKFGKNQMDIADLVYNLIFYSNILLLLAWLSYYIYGLTIKVHCNMNHILFLDNIGAPFASLVTYQTHRRLMS